MSQIKVRKHFDGTVWVIAINRPARRNAVDGVCASQLAKAFRQFDKDSVACVAILTGEGPSFCAGADLKAFSNPITSTPPAESADLVPLGPMGPSRFLLSKPVIAAIEGFCVAGGLELALWCDLRVASETAQFGVACRRWGVPLIDGGTVRLPAIIGRGRALQMILSAEMVPADTALNWGLVNYVAPKGRAVAKALSVAQELTKFPQKCMRSDRMSVYTSTTCADTGYWKCGVGTQLRKEFQLGQQVLESGESKRGALRFVNRRGHPSTASTTGSRVQCVFIDLGGVVFDSPIQNIKKLCDQRGLDARTVSVFLAMSKAFKRLETGVVDANGFVAEFQQECDQQSDGYFAVSDGNKNARVNAKEVYTCMSKLRPRPLMMECIWRLKQLEPRVHVCAITNNWKMSYGKQKRAALAKESRLLRSLFGNNIVESCVVGVRKPDPAIFKYALREMGGIDPSRCVFLDDIGRNLKTARQLGMQTVRVHPLQGERGVLHAISELNRLVTGQANKLHPLLGVDTVDAYKSVFQPQRSKL